MSEFDWMDEDYFYEQDEELRESYETAKGLSNSELRVFCSSIISKIYARKLDCIDSRFLDMVESILAKTDAQSMSDKQRLALVSFYASHEQDFLGKFDFPKLPKVKDEVKKEPFELLDM